MLIQKKCGRCGSDMDLMLRNVVYRNRVKIQNVPVHVCTADECSYSQVVEIVKDDLKGLMEDLGRFPKKQEIGFEGVSEFSNLLVMVADQQDDELTVQQVVGERVDELLDLYLLAKSLGDYHWTGEIRQRLLQIS
ncbi:hypothetical protein [Brevibacillus dissolubilis]|uniref:hypothetical protein n=1 Tax=Brevibacillus dissolubilis TaxID=1844116 RepID=UPI0020FFFB1D|nr:hypothetical protein [Brevibacillus dissolubilis]